MGLDIFTFLRIHYGVVLFEGSLRLTNVGYFLHGRLGDSGRQGFNRGKKRVAG